MTTESHDPHLLVARGDPSRAEVALIPREELAPGALRVRIDRFGLTTNNVTYAAVGEAFHYFKFFPPPAPLAAEGWAGLPVWGLGTVVESRAPSIAAGAEVYGFFPAAGHAVLTPAREGGIGFVVERPQVPREFSIYHQYALADRDPFHVEGMAEWVVAFRPLFLTGLLLADQLAAFDFHGAGAVVVSSASSKTAYGVAAALRRRAHGRAVIGLSSARNQAFAAGLGVYDRVLTYEELAALPRGVGVVHVDIAGGPRLRAELAQHLGDELQLHLGVGITHGAPGESSARSEFFFAPAWMLRRTHERGAAFAAELADGWRALLAGVVGRFHVERGSGADEALRVYRALAAGESAPEKVHALTLA